MQKANQLYNDFAQQIDGAYGILSPDIPAVRVFSLPCSADRKSKWEPRSEPQRYRVFSPHLLYKETFRCRQRPAAGRARWSAAPTGNGAFSWSTIEGLKQNPVSFLRCRAKKQMGTVVTHSSAIVCFLRICCTQKPSVAGGDRLPALPAAGGDQTRALPAIYLVFSTVL